MVYAWHLKTKLMGKHFLILAVNIFQTRDEYLGFSQCFTSPMFSRNKQVRTLESHKHLAIFLVSA